MYVERAEAGTCQLLSEIVCCLLLNAHQEVSEYLAATCDFTLFLITWTKIPFKVYHALYFFHFILISFKPRWFENYSPQWAFPDCIPVRTLHLSSKLHQTQRPVLVFAFTNRL